MKLAEFQKVGNVLAKEHKITIEAGSTWAANIKNRKVYYKKDDIYTLPEDHILGMLLHEVAHIHYTTDTKLPKKNEALIHTTMNVLEDISIENIIGKDYPNAAEILHYTKDEVLDTLVRMLPTLNHLSLHERALLYAAARFEDRGYAFGIEKYEKVGITLSKIMLKKKNAILNRKATANLLPIAEEMVKILLKEFGEPTNQEKNQMLSSGFNGNTEAIADKGLAGNAIKGLKAGHGWKEGIPTHANVCFIDEIADQAARVGKQLRTVLKRNNAMEFGGRYRTGKLLPKRFVKIKTTRDRNPFARRIVKSNQSYAFAIASDISGSMFSSFVQKTSGSYALSSMYMVGEALKLANVPRSLSVFGHDSLSVAPMGKTQLTWDQIASQKLIGKADEAGTSIHKAIDNCTKELKNIKAERKIMIILTDGASDKEDMKIAHTKATKEGIECLAIEIAPYGYQHLQNVFGKDKVTSITDTKNTAQIGQAFIDILKNSITKSP